MGMWWKERDQEKKLVVLGLTAVLAGKGPTREGSFEPTLLKSTPTPHSSAITLLSPFFCCHEKEREVGKLAFKNNHYVFVFQLFDLRHFGMVSDAYHLFTKPQQRFIFLFLCKNDYI